MRDIYSDFDRCFEWISCSAWELGYIRSCCLATDINYIVMDANQEVNLRSRVISSFLTIANPSPQFRRRVVYNEGLGQSPQRGLGDQSLVREQSPLKLNVLCCICATWGVGQSVVLQKKKSSDVWPFDPPVQCTVADHWLCPSRVDTDDVCMCYTWMSVKRRRRLSSADGWMSFTVTCGSWFAWNCQQQ